MGGKVVFSTRRYKIASSDITLENFDGEYVILNLASGTYFSLTADATIFLDGLLQGGDAQAVIDCCAGRR